MESLISYGSDDEQDSENLTISMGRSRDSHRRREQEDNYDNVGMDMSDEDSNNAPPQQDGDRRSKTTSANRDNSKYRNSRDRSRSRDRGDSSRQSNLARDNTSYLRKYIEDHRRKSRSPSRKRTSNKIDNSVDIRKETFYERSRGTDKLINRSSSRDRRSGSYEKGSSSRDHYRKSSKSPGLYPRRRSTSRGRRERSKSRDRRDKSRSRERIDQSKNREYKDIPKRETPEYIRRDRRDKSRSRDDTDRSTSRDRKYRSKSRDRKYRSKSRERRNRSKSRDRKYRSTSRDRRNRSNSRDRKYRSKSRDRRDRSKSRDQLNRSKSRDLRDETRGRDRKDRSRSRDRVERSRSPARFKSRFDRTSNKLAVLEKLGIEIKTPDSQFMTPQMLMHKSLSDKIEEVKNATGIELPKYYNPAVMNPSRYAEQIQKRRLLWGNKKTSTETEQAQQVPNATINISTASSTISASTAAIAGAKNSAVPKIWQQTKFVHDNDGKVASKFKRLMGIKDDNNLPAKELTNTETLKKQEEMFHSMEAQYEVARAATHTMRGVGLGFGAFTGNFPR